MNVMLTLFSMEEMYLAESFGPVKVMVRTQPVTVGLELVVMVIWVFWTLVVRKGDDEVAVNVEPVIELNVIIEELPGYTSISPTSKVTAGRTLYVKDLRMVDTWSEATMTPVTETPITDEFARILRSVVLLLLSTVPLVNDSIEYVICLPALNA